MHGAASASIWRDLQSMVFWGPQSFDKTAAHLTEKYEIMRSLGLSPVHFESPIVAFPVLDLPSTMSRLSLSPVPPQHLSPLFSGDENPILPAFQEPTSAPQSMAIDSGTHPEANPFISQRSEAAASVVSSPRSSEFEFELPSNQETQNMESAISSPHSSEFDFRLDVSGQQLDKNENAGPSSTISSPHSSEFNLGLDVSNQELDKNKNMRPSSAISSPNSGDFEFPLPADKNAQPLSISPNSAEFKLSLPAPNSAQARESPSAISLRSFEFEFPIP
ncbi:hypothetical protein EST38_g13286 [Candolleomyces aberdarensis]|uniref:Uncharacterized protein n=1 Tax=Candolleomyces aberdarensis TaxID=2316362 RepID=A0A4V1Q1S1_9AGAR|nr:hypothetical protein EST38_g13286 [Candolleomyces aberdarensis]